MPEVQHLTFGDKDAEHTVEAFINFACPYCLNYFKAADTSLNDYIEDGRVHYIIKHFDKTKERLLKGTVANLYLDYNDPDETLKIIRHLFETQDEWILNFETIERKMENELALSPQKNAGDRSLAIHQETFERGIKGVPVIFIDGKAFDFDPTEDDIPTIQQKLITALD